MGNGADVAIPLESICSITEWFSNTTYGLLLGKRVAYLIVDNYFSSEDGLDAMIENGSWFIRNNLFILKKWNPDVNLQKEDVGSVLGWVKFHVVPMMALSEDSLRIIATNIGFSMSGNLPGVRLAGGKNKQAGASRQEVSNFNPFGNLNSNENDDDLGSNGGNSKLAGNGSLNVAHGSSINTPIIDKIDKLERQMLDGKLMFMDDDGNPLVPTGNVNSESEVEVVFDETANLMALKSFKRGSDKGYGTNSLLEEWRETKQDDDYDPYDNDLYESHDMSSHLHAICDDFHIMVRGWKKK
ncbi:zinc knuckle CX2CX4HX4C containing protein [Tanacetum coccineum]|uniref:Zinc knuckle CX2CX4HX4C containing protein n=1 Tax=Tanacetum coccineum TaxID=301880 RepID=A0ABQ4XLY7_9ASTR